MDARRDNLYTAKNQYIVHQQKALGIEPKFKGRDQGLNTRVQCDKAGLPQCSAHGLRKAAASRLADISCTAHEIMSITGHDSISEVQRYTKTAQRKQLAESVRNRVDGQK